MFALAWFHALVEERRKYIPQVGCVEKIYNFIYVSSPRVYLKRYSLFFLGIIDSNIFCQGWTKFYEFSMADLRAGADIIDRLYKKSGKTTFQQFHWS